MNGIIGMLDLLSHTDLTAEQQQYVNQLKNANTYLMNIMHDILDWSKIQSGQAAFNHQTVDIKLLCEQVFAGFSGLADENKYVCCSIIRQWCHRILSQMPCECAKLWQS